MPDKIFISYRRDDAAAFAALLNARLTERFGPDRVFIDVDSIGPGVDFVDSIAKAVPVSAIMLAVIGRRWNPERLHNPRDLVRLEMLAAIEHGTLIIPILLEEVEMPRQEALPEELGSLIRRNAVEISTPRMNLDIRRLIEEIEQIFRRLVEKRETAPLLGDSQRMDPLPSPVQLERPPADPGVPRAAAARTPAEARKRRVPLGKTALIGVAGLALAVVTLLGWRLLRKKEAAVNLPVASVTGVTIRGRAFSEEYLREHGLPDLSSGLEVAGLLSEGPAERAGLVKGDIVRKLDGRLLKTADDFVAEVLRRRPGQSVTLEVWRGTRFLDISVPLEEGFTLTRRYCDSGRLEGCEFLGGLYQFVAKDLKRAEALYRQACDGDYFRACTSLGALYETGAGAAKDPVKAASLYMRACDGKDGLACDNLASLFERGLGLPKDFVRAAALYQQGCSLQVYWGCVRLGVLNELGSAMEKNPIRAAMLYGQACSAGDAVGCVRLGYLASQGVGVTKDLQRAANLFRAACGSGNVDGCFSLGISYENGYGVETDPKRAAALYELVCDGKNGGGCLYLGLLYHAGKGVEKDLSRGAGLFQRGCDLSWQDSCNELAILYQKGEGVGKDLPRAVSLLSTACDSGNARACNNLGVAYEQGDGIEKDIARGAALYQKSCDGEVPTACSNLGRLYELGEGIPRDAVKASELYRKACTGGIAQACTRLKHVDG